MDNDKLKYLLKDKNFLGAYSLIKNSSLSIVDRDVELGYLANYLLKEISLLKENDELCIFYRSVLFLLAKDIPGLQDSYRMQQRLQTPTVSLSTIMKGMQNLSDIQSGKKTIYEGINDGSELLKEVFSDNLDIINQKIKDPQEQAKVVDAIADGINNGLKNLSGIFDIIEGKNNKKRE